MKNYDEKIILLKKYYKVFGNYDKAVKKMIEEGIISDEKEVKGLTLDEIGYVLGVTRERVRQLEEQAKRKIKQHCLINKIKYEDFF